MECKKLIKYGILLRYILTIVTYYVLYYYIDSNNIYLILPICLTLLDEVDNIFTKYDQDKDLNIFKNSTNKCNEEFYYVINDKICDLVSYLLLLFFFDLDYMYICFILYRMIGVTLLYFTKDIRWLMLFFDFIKEYLLYLHIFANNMFYMPIFIICKIIYEYLLHKHQIKIFS